MTKLIWTTQKRKINSLLPYDKNPRKITEVQMKDLKRSFKKFNIVELPAINRDGTIVAGHQRVRALQLLGRGEEQIEVRVPNRKLTEAEFKNYLLTSNHSGGSFDFDILAKDFDIGTLSMAGFEGSELNDIFSNTLEVADDDFEESVELKKIKKIDVKPGDIYQLGRHRLICADALIPETAKKLMGNVRADMVNDDIPFNINLSYDKGVGNKGSYGGTHADNKTDDEYRTFVKTIIQNSLSVTKSNAHVIFWCDERFVWLLQVLYKELGIDSKRLLIWLKDNASPTPTVAFNKVTEFAVYGTIGRPFLSKKINNLNQVANKNVGTGNKLAEDILDQLNIWMVKRLPSNQYQHPTQKSPSLHEKALRRCTKLGDVVLDLTAGSGSILSACEQLGRTAYVCEKEPIFCQLIINRFKKISNEKIKKLN